MDSIKEGSIDLADSTIDLADIEDAYNEDLDQDASKIEDFDQDDMNQQVLPSEQI